MAVQYSNNASSTLASSLTASSSDTTLVVTTGEGDKFPVIASPDVAYVTLEDSAGNIEIVQVTARSSGSDSMTVVRSREGTTLQAWAAGTLVELRPTAAGLNSKADKVSGATSGNLAELDSNGNLVDSGIAESDKADKVAGATNGNLAELDASGNLVDSGISTSKAAQNRFDVEFLAQTLTIISNTATSFVVSGDHTSVFTTGRMLQLTDDSPKTFVDRVTSSSYNSGTGQTTVGISANGNVIVGTLTQIALGVLSSQQNIGAVEMGFFRGVQTITVAGSTATVDVYIGTTATLLGFGCMLRSNDSDSSLCACQIIDSDQNSIVVRAGNTLGSFSAVTSRPAAGYLRLVAFNGASSSRDITINWWAKTAL